MTTPVLVLRSGGDFLPEHVDALVRALRDVGGLTARPVVLTDLVGAVAESNFIGCDVRPLQRRFPGWWSKMELFAPWNRDLGDIFYVDLDTVVVSGLADMAAEPKLILLRDFNKADQLQSGLMLLPVAVRRRVWALWDLEPERFMKWFVRYGDGSLLDALLGTSAQTWQDLFPGRVVSYKLHVRRKSSPFYDGPDVIPAGASVVCYHGRPRPWAKDRPSTQELVERTSSSYYLKGRKP